MDRPDFSLSIQRAGGLLTKVRELLAPKGFLFWDHNLLPWGWSLTRNLPDPSDPLPRPQGKDAHPSSVCREPGSPDSREVRESTSGEGAPQCPGSCATGTAGLGCHSSDRVLGLSPWVYTGTPQTRGGRSELSGSQPSASACPSCPFLTGVMV